MDMTETQGNGTAGQQQPNPQPKVEPNSTDAGQTSGDSKPKEDVKSETSSTQAKESAQTDNKRTQEQFEKLLDSNKRLYEANELLRQQLTQRALSNEQFAPIQQPPQQAPAQQVNVADFVEIDPVSGERYIDDKKLQTKIEELNNKASKAEEAVQSYIKTAEQREIDRQNEEAFNAFPELNPSGDKFDVKFHNQTRALIYDSLINPQDYGGKPLSFRQAAEFAKGGDKAVTNSEKNQQASASTKSEGQTAAETSPDTGVDAKQQAAASVAGEQPATREQLASSEELKELQQATRRGNTEALARRIANTDHMVKKEEGESEKAS